VVTPVPAAAQVKLSEFLNSLEEYVILRNQDVWSSLARGSDVDLLVKDTDRAEKALLLHLGMPLRMQGNSYVTSYFYPWGQIDLWPRLEWRGAVYLPNQAVIGQAERSRFGFASPRLAHEAAVSWLNFALRGGFFKERYRMTILEAARNDGAALREALVYAAGPVWGERLWLAASEGRPETSANWVGPVRRAVWWRACRRDPRNTLLGWLAHWKAELGLRLRPPLPWVTVLGPDGSGKSSVLVALKCRLGPPPFKDVRIHHWRPGFLRADDGRGPVTDPHGKPPRGTLASVAKLIFLFLDWTLGYWGYLAHFRAKGGLMLFDRDYCDLLVDYKRYRYSRPLWLAKLMRKVIPRPNLVVLLDAPPEVLHGRKQEVSLDETARQRRAYFELVSSLPEGCVVDATRPLDDVVTAVEKVILNYVVERTAHELGWYSREDSNGL